MHTCFAVKFYNDLAQIERYEAQTMSARRARYRVYYNIIVSARCIADR